VALHVDIGGMAPEGTVVNAVSPAGMVGGNDIALRLCDLGFKAFVAIGNSTITTPR